MRCSISFVSHSKVRCWGDIPSACPVVELWVLPVPMVVGARPVPVVAGLVNVTWCGLAQPFTGKVQVSVFGCSLRGSPDGPEKARSASCLQGRGLRTRNQSGGESVLEFVGVLSLNPCFPDRTCTFACA